MSAVQGTRPPVQGIATAANHCCTRAVQGVQGVQAPRARARAQKIRAQRNKRAFPVRVYTLHTLHTLHSDLMTRVSAVQGIATTKKYPAQPAMSQSLRQQMPAVATWIDDLRQAFGADQINPAIKAGIDGQPTFWAKENGIEVGTPHPVAENATARDDDGLPAHFCTGCRHHEPVVTTSGAIHRRCHRPPAAGATCPNRCPFWSAP